MTLDLKTLRFSKKCWLLLSLVTGLGFVVWFWIDTEFRHAYHIRWTKSMLIRYVNENHSWPNNWDEMYNSYAEIVREVGQPFSFKDIKNTVLINWDVNLSRPDDNAFFVKSRYFGLNGPSRLANDNLRIFLKENVVANPTASPELEMNDDIGQE